MQTTIKKSETKLQNRTTNGTSKAIPQREETLREKIEARALEIYLARGAEPGHEIDDWLQAEHEIRNGIDPAF